MKHILALFVAISASGQTAAISDTLTASVGGGSWTGRIQVSLNSPGSASPLYSGTTSLAGWSYTLCVGVTGSDCTATTSAGTVTLTLYTNSAITPAGTSYTARYSPTRGTGWSETWVVGTGDTKLYEIRSTAIPTPTVMIAPSQISAGGATSGQCLSFNGSSWTPISCGVGGRTWAQLTGITWDEMQ